MSKYYKVEDVIRKRAEDLADTSYWEYGNPKNVDEWIEVAEMEFKDLPTIEVSEDCISREYALEVINDCINYPTNGDKACAIKNAPSVVPSRAEGEWAVEERDSYFGKKIKLTCSECGDMFSVTESEYPNERYCRYCGAKMKKTFT